MSSIRKTGTQKQTVIAQLAKEGSINKVLSFHPFFRTRAAETKYQEEIKDNFKKIDEATDEELKDPETLLMKLNISDKHLVQYYMEYILYLLNRQQSFSITAKTDRAKRLSSKYHDDATKEMVDRQREQVEAGLTSSTLPLLPMISRTISWLDRRTRRWNLVLGAGPVGLYAAYRLLQRFPDQAVVMYEVRKNFLDREQMFAITPENMARLQRLGIGINFLFNHTFQLFNPPWEGNGSGITRTAWMSTVRNRPFALRINDMQQTLYETLTRNANFRDRFFMIRPRRKNFTNIKCKIVIDPPRQDAPSRSRSWYLFWDEDKEKNYHLELSNKDIGSIIDATGGRGAGFLGIPLLSQGIAGGQSLASSFGAIVYLFDTGPPHVLRIPEQRTPSELQHRFRLFQDFDPSTGRIRGCYLGIQVSRDELQRYRQYRPQETTTDEPLIQYLVGLARDLFFGRDFAIAAYINTKNFFDVEVKQYQNR